MYRRASIGLALAVVAAAPAAAQKGVGVVEGCMSADAAKAVAACGALIDADNTPPGQLVGAYVNRGTALARIGMMRQAMADLDKAIALDPHAAPAWMARGLANGQRGMIEQAILDFTQAITLQGDLAGAYRGRAYAYEKQGQYDKAIADYAKTIELMPDKPDGYNGRAWNLHLKGDDAGALADAEKAVELAPKDAGILETRAEIYEKLGKHDEAVAGYKAALKLDPKMTSAKDGLARLAGPAAEAKPVTDMAPEAKAAASDDLNGATPADAAKPASSTD